MRSALHTRFPVLLTILCSALAACGGGAAEPAASLPTSVSTGEMVATSLATSTYIPQSRGTTTPPPSSTQVVSVTTVQLTNPTAVAHTGAGATFGQAFAQGDVRSDETLVGRTAAGVSVPLQVDAKARHADGSLRHAVITAQLPSSAANQVDTISLVKSAGATASTGATPEALLSSGFSARFTASIAGVGYTASADELLRSGKYKTWLSGPLVNEWIVAAPLKDAAGVEHPHLMAQFAVRSYSGSSSARVDVTIENGWAFQASPQNFTYDASMLVGGQPVYSQAALTHYHHARWRKVFWWGKEQPLTVRHNASYLLGTKAVPNYDQALVIKDATIAAWKTRWTTAKTGPMQVGVATPYLPTTGARPDIGPMPAWNALYLLSMDQRMKDVALGMSDLAGTWSAHYRNKATGRPVTTVEFPYMSIFAPEGDTINPATRKSEKVPACPADRCATLTEADVAHQPAFSYVPYLVTGDYYHLEELQFWANWNSFQGNPHYREFSKSLVHPEQARGQAWSLRTMAEAAYITPDNDPQKANFTTYVENNIQWYSDTYSRNPAANKLGVLNHNGIVEYEQGLGLAPWQDDFFTAMVGRVAELGFTNAEPLLSWKSKFVVDRMAGEGFCWIGASSYSLRVRATPNSPLYTTIGQVYEANNIALFSQLECGSLAMATALKIRVNELVGDFSASGPQAIMQPALAYSANANAKGKTAWAVYANRPFKPDSAAEPQYAIVPR